MKLKKLKTLLILTTVTSLITSCGSAPIRQETTSPLPEPATIVNPDTGLNKCDKALNSCGKALKDQQTLVVKQDEMLKAQAKEITDLKETNNSFFRKPYVWFVLGGLAGIFLPPAAAPLIGVGLGFVFK